MEMVASNFQQSLYFAIKQQREHERTMLKYTGDSGMVAGWQAALDASRRGEQAVVLQSDEF